MNENGIFMGSKEIQVPKVPVTVGNCKSLLCDEDCYTPLHNVTIIVQNSHKSSIVL
jgi:hypothetical protein